MASGFPNTNGPAGTLHAMQQAARPAGTADELPPGRDDLARTGMESAHERIDAHLADHAAHGEHDAA